MLCRMSAVLLALILSVTLSLPAWAQPLLLVDMRNAEVLYEEDAGLPWHPASLTKLMTALVTFNAIANGRLTLETPVKMSAAARRAPPSKVGFPEGMAVTMEVALNLLLVKSANDIAIAIAETVSGSEASFVAEMNQLAQTIGMSATNFVNPHGLHNKAQVTTARDLAVLAFAIRQNFPQYLPIFRTTHVTLGDAVLDSNNNLLTSFRGTTGMKTGFVCSAGLNIVVTVDRDGRQLLAIVLGASSGRERGEQAGQMLTGALRGTLRGTGKHVSQIVNQTGVAPTDMRPNLCGEGARAYVAARETAFPYGLEGQASFLNDSVAPRTFVASTLGIIRDVPLPRPRPANMPFLRKTEPVVTEQSPETGLPGNIPFPRPRPAMLGARS